MNIEEFFQQIQALRSKVAAIVQRTDNLPISQQQQLECALEQLGIALKELQIALEQLQQQNEELADARALTQREQEHYQKLFEEAPDGYLVTDAFGVIQQANRAACTLLNVKQQFVIGKPLINYILQKERPAFHSQLNQLRQAKRVQEWEVRLIPRNGKPIDAALNVVVVRSQEAEPVALRWLIRDITKRKQAELTLRQQFERERLLVDIAQRIRSSLNLEEILNTTVVEVRQFLQTDRVFVYRFDSDHSGVVVVESVDSGWSFILDQTIVYPNIESYVYSNKQEQITAIEDIYTAGLAQHYIDLLAKFQVRAKLAVPIQQGQQLWGLLIVHHCRGPRQWQVLEIDLLKQLATQVAIAIQQSQLYQQLHFANQELQRLASNDGLTEVANRRHFDQYLNSEWRRLAREQAPVSLILCDIDLFKSYNDTYGHQMGDDCLRQVAKAISCAVKRPADLVARYGGEEFVVVLPNTETSGAIRVAEEIRSRVKALQIAHGNSHYVTLSLGVAFTIPSHESSPATLIAAADQALYQAKQQGRDRVWANDFP